MAPLKKERDGYHPSSHYLVVEDPKTVTTWHLRVKNASGNLDHGLMGNAWAALHGGFQGNKYEGPHKQDAIDKLKKLYDSEKMSTPPVQHSDVLEHHGVLGQHWGVTTQTSSGGSRAGRKSRSNITANKYQAAMKGIKKATGHKLSYNRQLKYAVTTALVASVIGSVGMLALDAYASSHADEHIGNVANALNATGSIFDKAAYHSN